MALKKLPRKLNYAMPPPVRRQSWREWWWEQCKGLLALAAALAFGVVLLLSRRIAFGLLVPVEVFALGLMLKEFMAKSRLWWAGRSAELRFDFRLLYGIALLICALAMTIRAVINAR